MCGRRDCFWRSEPGSLFWRRAAIFCKATLKKSTSNVFSASNCFASRNCCCKLNFSLSGGIKLSPMSVDCHHSGSSRRRQRYRRTRENPQLLGQGGDIDCNSHSFYGILLELRRIPPVPSLLLHFATPLLQSVTLPVGRDRARCASCRRRVTSPALSVAGWVHISAITTFPEAPR